jgi:hypothetical protein
VVFGGTSMATQQLAAQKVDEAQNSDMVPIKRENGRVPRKPLNRKHVFRSCFILTLFLQILSRKAEAFSMNQLSGRTTPTFPTCRETTRLHDIPAEQEGNNFASMMSSVSVGTGNSTAPASGGVINAGSMLISTNNGVLEQPKNESQRRSMV